MKVLTVVGARPQFIKAAVVSAALRKHQIPELVVHTGQHFDPNMSAIFFEQLGIPLPAYNLDVKSLSHGAMTGRMMERIESILDIENPDWLVVYGDTNSTLAGALAAVKRRVKVAHIEAGLRSHNLEMPEEINRVLTDRISDLLLCPTESAVANLNDEGFPFSTPQRQKQRIKYVGDVMYDLSLLTKDWVIKHTHMSRYGLDKKAYVLATIHRQENTDNIENLAEILKAFCDISKDVKLVLPIHPRTLKAIKTNKLMNLLSKVLVLDPLPYIEMQSLLTNARLVLTDSGGVQKEAYFNKVGCLTIRAESEWPETFLGGCNRLVMPKSEEIYSAYSEKITPDFEMGSPFGDGNSAEKIVSSLIDDR